MTTIAQTFEAVKAVQATQHELDGTFKQYVNAAEMEDDQIPIPDGVDDCRVDVTTDASGTTYTGFSLICLRAGGTEMHRTSSGDAPPDQDWTDITDDAP